MTKELFLSIYSDRLSEEIASANKSVCYFAPGIRKKTARAIAGIVKRIGKDEVIVCIDFGEHSMRLGFGSLGAVDILKKADVEVVDVSGLRIGLIVIDDYGYVFTPTALLLEPENTSDSAPNAIRLSEDQVKMILSRLPSEAKPIARRKSKSDEKQKRILRQPKEIKSKKIEKEKYEEVKKNLDEVPPVKFDLERQVRVYNARICFVEIRLTGAAIHRHRLKIPKIIQSLGDPGEELLERLNTTFDLIRKDKTELVSREIETSLNKIRKNITPSLGKLGRVMLKKNKCLFERKIECLKEKLEDSRKKIETELKQEIDNSKRQVVDYYTKQVCNNPPETMHAHFREPITEEKAKMWLDHELGQAFPTASNLVEKMQLDVIYKDVTFEMLNNNEFFASIKKAFPFADWGKAYNDFTAARESSRQEDFDQNSMRG